MKVLRFLAQGWVISLLGVIALSLLIWFIGPLVAIGGAEPLISPITRLVVIFVLVALWGVINFIAFVRRSRNEKEITEGIVDEGADSTQGMSEEEVAVLRERFEEGMGILKTSRKKGVSLYELPWYVIIGPPGSGKTTALVNSGLNFPLAERFGNEALRGVGGTRNCDWWFTDEAVLLDTAGRYVTQDSHSEVDSAAWGGFLDLLRKYRKRRPINGVFVAISLSDLMTQSEADRAAHVRAIRQRIIELYDHFRIRFPVYVLLTKADLAAGFMEFFDDLGQDERAQVWGMTFPLDDTGKTEDIAGQFNREYDFLLERLNARLLSRMAQERDVQRRAMIYGFPRQMAALKPLLGEFLGGIFRSNRYEDPILVRGVYLTSGTQEGTPIDRIMGSLARTFGLGQQVTPAFGGQGRSYFITDMLRGVAFKESELAGTNRRVERQRAWLQRSTYFGLAAATVLAVAAWFVSYNGNRGLIDEVAAQGRQAEQQLEALSSNDTGVEAPLPVLNTLRDMPAGYAASEEGHALTVGFGLYQGDRLEPAAVGAYRRVLNSEFLPRVMLRLEQQMTDGGANTDYLFEALKVYLMLDDPEHFDADAVKAWMAFDWDQNLPRSVSTEDREALNAHLGALLEKLPSPLPVALDEQLVRRSRQVLMRVPLAERVYGRLKRQRFGSDLPQFSIADAGGRDAPLVFRRISGDPLTEGVSGLYTYKGFHQVFVDESARMAERLAEESWVLGADGQVVDDSRLSELADEPAAREALYDEVLALYLEDFSKQYKDLLADVSLIPPDNLSEAVEMLSLLSDKRFSPLLKLLQAVERETALDREEKPEAEDAEDDDGKLEDARRELERTIGLPRQPRLPMLSGRSARVAGFVRRNFGSLQEQMRPDDSGQFAFQGVMDMLDELYRFLDTVKNDPNSAAALMEKSGQLRSLVDEMRREASRQPEMVGDMLGQVTTSVTGLTSGGVRNRLNELWRSEGLGFCQQAIAGRYPLMRDSRREVRLPDFGEFFGPGGIMDRYFSTHLVDYVDTSRSQWRWRPGAEMAGGSSAALKQFERSRVIRDTFFRGGAAEPKVQFELKPLTMDTSIDQFNLDLEGQQVSYSHGPAVPKRLTWPGPGPHQVRIQLSPAVGNSGTTEDGAWGWFRLLDRSSLSAGPVDEVYVLTFTVGGRSAQYQLTASSAFNPFKLRELESFRCPERL